MHPKVSEKFETLELWKEETPVLRSIVLSCGLQEEFKWKQACYTYQGKNIVLLFHFKHYCALSFFKGVLLQDTRGVLVQQTENVQADRQWRFTSLDQITSSEAQIKQYLFEAIEIEKQGLKVALKKTSDFAVPQELKDAFAKDQVFQAAFEALSAGRQRGYLLFFAQAKQSKTRASRIAKNRNRILRGFGLNDCICGRSKRMPSCDGSHKQLKTS